MLIVAFTLLFLAGAAWGIHEAFYADRYLFEIIWGVQPESFWGSQSWKRNYVNNNPTLPHKTNLLNTVRDVKHFTAAVGRHFYAAGVIVLVLSAPAWMLAPGAALYSLTAAIVYNVLRARRKNSTS